MLMLLSLVCHILCWVVGVFVLNMMYKHTSPCTYVSCLKHGSMGEFLMCFAKYIACSHHLRIFFAAEFLALSVMVSASVFKRSSNSGWRRLMHLIRNLLILLTNGLLDMGVRSSVLHDACIVLSCSGMYLYCLSWCRICLIAWLNGWTCGEKKERIGKVVPDSWCWRLFTASNVCWFLACLVFIFVLWSFALPLVFFGIFDAWLDGIFDGFFRLWFSF